MAILSQGQIEVYARSAGLPPDRATVAAAVAMAESSGNKRALNSTAVGRTYGLWQINMLGGMGPERRRRYGLKADSDLYDPAVNARVMADMSANGTNWSAWEAYTGPDGVGSDGPWRRYQRGGGTAPTDPAATTPAGIEDFIPGGDSVRALAELGIGAASWVSNPRSWVRVAQVIVGGSLIVSGLAVATQSSWSPIRALKGTAVLQQDGKVAPSAGVQKMARAVRTGGRGVSKKAAPAQAPSTTTKGKKT